MSWKGQKAFRGGPELKTFKQNPKTAKRTAKVV